MFKAINEAIIGVFYGGGQDPRAVSNCTNYGPQGQQKLKERGAEHIDHSTPHDVFTKNVDYCEAEVLFQRTGRLYQQNQNSQPNARVYR